MALALRRSDLVYRFTRYVRYNPIRRYFSSSRVLSLPALPNKEFTGFGRAIETDYAQIRAKYRVPTLCPSVITNPPNIVNRDPKKSNRIGSWSAWLRQIASCRAPFSRPAVLERDYPSPHCKWNRDYHSFCSSISIYRRASGKIE